jgi:hypothetical protein
LQNDGGWYVVPEHDAVAPQATEAACCVQLPLPLQTPVLPQAPFGAQRLCGSPLPAPTLVQVPAPVRLHAWQVAQALVLQQTPSTQLPLTHWLPAPHVPPRARFAWQLPGADVFPVQ